MTQPQEERLRMRTRIFRLFKLLLMCYFLISGILVLIAGCSLLWFFWRTQHTPFGYESAHGQVKAIPLPPPKRALTAEERAFGEKQVEEMVRDRPEMGRYVHKGDPIWQFCARQYGGDAIGEGINWESSPTHGGNAEHAIPYQGMPGEIRIRAYDSDRQQANSCEELWAYVLFELVNIRNHTHQEEAWDAAMSGKIDRQEYIKRAAQLEYQAFPYVVSIYNTLWKPTMEAKGIATTPLLWRLMEPGSADDWFEQYRYMGSNFYPSVPYGTGYDAAVMPLLQLQAQDTIRPSGKNRSTP